MSRAIGRAAAGLVLLTMLPLTGCGPASTNAPAPGAGSATSTPDLTTDAVLDSPLQSYRLSVTELTTVSHARSILITQCMQRLGFDMPIGSFKEELAENRYGEHLALGRIYGITDRRAAAKYGYAGPPEHKITAEQHSPSPAELLALKGRTAPGTQNKKGASIANGNIPPGGCVGEVERLFEKDPDISNYGLGHTLWIEAMSRLQGSDVFRAIVADWSACLARQGYAATSPLDDQGDIKRITGAGSAQGKATPAEIKLALADIDCKTEVDLVGRLNDAGRTIANALIEQNQLALEEDSARLERQLRLAASLVKEGS